MNEIQISVGPAAERLKKLRRDLSDNEVKTAAKLALNDAARTGKTLVRKGIMDVYNIKRSRIEDSNRKKGLSIAFANNNHLEAKVNAGHIPVNLINIDGNKTETRSYTELKKSVKWKGRKGSKQREVKLKKKGAVVKGAGISVEVVKGERKLINSAFTIGRFTKKGRSYSIPGKAVFARGKRQKVGFSFGKERMPIDAMGNISVAAAATNIKTAPKYQDKVNETAGKRFEHHIDRIIKKATS